MPAKAGIQNYLKTLDSRLRGNDAKGRFKTFYEAINIQRRSPLFCVAASICALFITNYFHYCSNYSGEGTATGGHITILWNYIFTI